MRRIIDNDEARIVWGLDSWYEKTFYVIGIILTVLFLIGFTVGFIQEIANPSGEVTNYNTEEY